MASMAGAWAALDEVGLTRANILAAVGANAELRQGVMDLAKDVKEYWQSIAPVSKVSHVYNGHLDEPGDYRDSIRVRIEKHADGFWVGTVFTNDWKAHWLEYGSIHNPEFGFAQKTVDNFGGGAYSGGAGYRVSA